MDTGTHIDALEREGRLLAAAAERAGLDAPVPACAPWQVKDLLRHIAYVHRWAAGYAAGTRPRGSGRSSEDELLNSGPPESELIAWYRDAHRDLLTALRSAGSGASYGAFLPAPSPLAFWARRQAHETAIHRADAEAASGPVTPFDPEFAADGIDELMGFAYRDKATLPPGSRRVMEVRTSDTGHSWLVDIGPAGIADVRRDTGPADCVLDGHAAELYLLLWNRQGADGTGVSVAGDAAVLALWRDHMRVRWE